MASAVVLFENYEKGDVKTVEKDPKDEFLPDISLPENTVIVRVKRGSKIKNLMAFVEKSLQEEEIRHMIFSGVGDAIEKTITCVEITKSEFAGLHQITRLNVLRVEEFWEPKKPELELDTLEVMREIPLIAILLCKDELDSSQLGYQAPICSRQAPQVKRKKNVKHTNDKRTSKSYNGNKSAERTDSKTK